MTPRDVVLVPVDFDDASVHAANVASRQAARTGGRVVLLHVCGLPPRGLRASTGEIGGAPAGRPRSDAQRDIERLAKRWGAEAVVRDGEAVETILAVASEVGARRIVMGTHGARGVERWMLGSVAEGVLRASDVPVMVVRDGAAHDADGGATAPRPVLCAVDFEHAEMVVPIAAELAREQGTTLELAHVYRLPVVDVGGIEPLLIEGLEDALLCDASAELGRLSQRFGAERWHVRRGHTGIQVLALIEVRHAAALVVGSHGRHGLARAALGSVAEWLVRRSPVPVLVTRYGSQPLAASERAAS
jgi:nucleotide-binding universal stress UspA family protein